MEDFYIEKGKVGSFFMRKIIIDCDPGIDDALAIMLAVNSPELEIVAITTVSGNVPLIWAQSMRKKSSDS